MMDRGHKHEDIGILYLSYDGILEPLGQSQVLSYLELLAVDREVHLVSFEKPADMSDGGEMSHIRKRVSATGIIWHPMVYHKRPTVLATTYDILLGVVVGSFLVSRHGLRIVHARSYVPAVMALIIKRLTGARYIFDMRGFWPDERVDGELWTHDSHIYRVAKWFERRLLLSADHVVSLTHKGIDIIRGFDYMAERMLSSTVIPTCADLDKFRPMKPRKPNGPFVLGYVGTVGTWYLFDEVARCVAILAKSMPDLCFLVVNRGEHGFIRTRLHAAGVPDCVVELISASHNEIPALMARMDAGIFFIKQVFSKQASAPTKLAEFLGCGIPCLVNTGVGDMAEILMHSNVGVAVEDFKEECLQDGLAQLLMLTATDGIAARCVATAQQYFSLDVGVSRYASIYEELT